MRDNRARNTVITLHVLENEILARCLEDGHGIYCNRHSELVVTVDNARSTMERIARYRIIDAMVRSYNELLHCR